MLPFICHETDAIANMACKNLLPKIKREDDQIDSNYAEIQLIIIEHKCLNPYKFSNESIEEILAFIRVPCREAFREQLTDIFNNLTNHDNNTLFASRIVNDPELKKMFSDTITHFSIQG